MTREGEPWHGGFVLRHRRRCPKTAWPSTTSDEGVALVQDWCRRMLEAGVTEAEAEAASVILAQDPPSRADRHAGELVRLVRESRSRSRSAAIETEMRAAKRAAQREDVIRRAQELLNRLAWSTMPADERARIWEAAGRERSINRIRYFRERSAWAIAGLPEPDDGLHTESEAREIVAGLEEQYGAAYDPTPPSLSLVAE